LQTKEAEEIVLLERGQKNTWVVGGRIGGMPPHGGVGIKRRGGMIVVLPVTSFRRDKLLKKENHEGIGGT